MSCTSDNITVNQYNCTIIDNEEILRKYSIPMHMCLSAIGVILNSLCVFIFKFSKNMEEKFLILLRHYSFNSLLFNFNVFMVQLVALCLPAFAFNWNETGIYFIDNYSFVLYYTYIYQNIWAILYTYAGILDIFIVYERILLYKPSVNFMRKQTARNISFYVFIFSIIINIPVIYSRQTKEYLLLLDDKEITVYRHGTRDLNENIIILVVTYLANFFRDITTCIIEITINIYLILAMFDYYRNKQSVLNRANNTDQITANNIIVFRKSDINNSRIAMFICFCSSLSHILVFSILIIFIFADFKVYIIYAYCIGLFFVIRHSLNFLIFLKLNKKFRRNFLVLVPNWMKIKNLGNGSSTNWYNFYFCRRNVNLELVNQETVMTRL